MYIFIFSLNKRLRLLGFWAFGLWALGFWAFGG